MIGAILAKRMAPSGYNAMNQRNPDKALGNLAEDATFTFPGKISISGVAKGKQAIIECHEKMLEHYPKMHFTVKEVFVSKILAMGGTNNVAIEYELSYTNREGKEFHNSGVTIARIKSGKMVSMKEYIFDLDTTNEAWGKE